MALLFYIRNRGSEETTWLPESIHHPLDETVQSVSREEHYVAYTSSS